MAIIVNDNIRPRTPKLIDARSGPYASVQAALAAINVNERINGLTVIIGAGDDQKEYWFKGGELVLKIGESGSGSVGGFEYIEANENGELFITGTAKIQKAILDRPMTIIDGMSRAPGDNGILILKQDDQGARYYQMTTSPGNIGNIYNDSFLPRAMIALSWYRDDENCYWSIDRVIKGIYPTTAPVFRVDDFNNVLEVFHSLPTSEVLISENNGPWTPYTGPINAGPVDRPFGYWRAYIPADETRTESPIAYSLPFHAANIGFTYTFNYQLS